MEPINVNLSCDIQQPVKVRYLDGYFFSKDSAGHRINVDVFDNGVPVSVGGSISADVIRSDGETVPVTGAVSGNRAYVILPQAAYAIVGAVQITIKVTEGTTIVTIASFVAYVHESDTDITVDPGTIIPSIQALISQIETAVASIPADYSSLWTSLAPAFSTSTAYAVGQYVTNSGVLYRFTTAHPAGTWNSAHVTAVNLGAEVYNLKSALSAYNSRDVLEEILTPTNETKNNVTFAWNGKVCTVSTTDAGASAITVNPMTGLTATLLPEGIVPGGLYALKYNTTDSGVLLRIRFYAADGTTTVDTKYITQNASLRIPTGSVKWALGLYIAKNTVITTPATVSDIRLINAKTNAELEAETAGNTAAVGAVFSGRENAAYVPKAKFWYEIPEGTASFDANTLTGNTYTRGTYGVLSATFAGTDAPEEITNLSDSTNIIIEKQLLNSTGNLYVLIVTCTYPMLCWKGYRRYNTTTQEYSFYWEKDIGRTYYYVTSDFDAKEIEDDAVVRGQYQYLQGTFTGMNPPAEITNIPATSAIEIEKHAYNSPNNLYYMRVMCHFPVVDLKVMRYYHTPSASYKYVWVAMERRHIYVSDTDANTFLVLRTDQGALYFDKKRQTNTNNYYHSCVLPVKKGDSVYLHTKVGSGQIKAYAKISVDYLKQEVYPSGSASEATEFDGTITFDYDGFLAFNIENANASIFQCWVDSEKTQDVVRASQFANALINPTNTLPEYDDDNVCRVLVRGASWMGAIHHWGIIGASFDSGEFNFRHPTADFVSEIDWYEYSCWKYLQRINGIPDMYCYSDGGQNARDWIRLGISKYTDYDKTPSRKYAYDSDTEEVATYYGDTGLSYRSGIGHDGGCWWKMYADYQDGNVKQAFVLNLGGNDINNENPHDANWNEYDEGDYNPALKYKCGTVDDIGTYDLETDTDTPPEGKTGGVVTGIVNSFAAYMGAIINRLIAIQPDCVIFLCTIHNMYADNAKRLALWEQYNDVIREIAELPQYENHIFLLDAAKYGPNFFSYPQYGFWVHYHPNAVGYTYMAWTWNTMIDYVMQKNLDKFKQSMFIGTGKSYTPIPT